jgi:hypothetical protein
VTFRNEDIAEVYAREQTIEDKKGQPGQPVFKHEPSFWELLYIGGTEEDFAHSHAEFIPEGFQTKKVGQRKRKVPAWALDNRFFIHVFGDAAMKRARVAYLFWRVGMTESQIAAETKFSEKYIRNVINKLRGKQAHRESSPQVSIGGANVADAPDRQPLPTSDASPTLSPRRLQ